MSATELERLVCGNPALDFAALQVAARYEGGFTPDHSVRPHILLDLFSFNLLFIST